MVKCEDLETVALIFDTFEMHNQLKTERCIMREINASFSLKLPNMASAKPHFIELYNKIASQPVVTDYQAPDEDSDGENMQGEGPRGLPIPSKR